MENAELTALQKVRDEYKKIKEKYQKKAIKEREKVNDILLLKWQMEQSRNIKDRWWSRWRN